MSEAKLEAKEARKALKAQKAEKRQAKREKSFLNKYFHHVDQGPPRAGKSWPVC